MNLKSQLKADKGKKMPQSPVYTSTGSQIQNNNQLHSKMDSLKHKVASKNAAKVVAQLEEEKKLDKETEKKSLA